MNSLSLFLYLADVAVSMSVMLAVLAVFAGFALIAMLAVNAVEHDRLYPYWKRHTAFIVAAALLASIIPSKQTMYAIAASEVGERVIASEKVQGIADDATKALQAWLRKQIDGEKSSAK